VTLFSITLTNGDLTKEAIVDVHDAIPSDGLWVYIQANEALDLIWSKVVWVGLIYAELLQAFEHKRRKLAFALLRWYQPSVQGFVCLCSLVEYSSIECRS